MIKNSCGSFPALPVPTVSPVVQNLVRDRKEIVYPILNILRAKIKYLYPK